MKSVRFAALLLAVTAPVVMMGPANAAKPKTTTLTGWVSDKNCGVKGASAGHAACAKKCVDGGAEIIFINAKNKSIFAVDNQDALKSNVGDYVKVTGIVTGTTLKVDKVSVLKPPKEKKAAAAPAEH